MRIVMSMFVMSFMLSGGVAAQDLESLKSLEMAAWEAWKDHDGEKWAKMAVDNAVQVSAAGGLAEGKAAISASFGEGCDYRSFSLSDWKLHKVADDTAVLTFTAYQDAVCNGRKLPERVIATSVYVRKGQNWLYAVYHESALTE